MRKLLYVPVIHVDSDLGSIAPAIDKRSTEICGRERWERHKQIVTTFWDNIEKYFKKLNADNLKIYQDGLMADGELGQKIIEETAQKGSRNYRIVLDLIRRGGEIRKTEDIALLKEEYNRILKLAQSKSLWERTTAYIGYRFHKGRLMMKRDKFIADTINKTLKEGETGALFIGAYHDVLSLLAKDIAVEEVKKREKVKAYFKMLISGKDEERFNELGKYLVDRGLLKNEE
ncbi:MAG: hypothetical protein Q7J27_10605 [Syntrophales bacterium]|nr:hypothetical protein [Syntrophales bacterium]